MKSKVFICIIGLSLIFMALFADIIGIGGKTPKAGFGKTQLLAFVIGGIIFLLGVLLKKQWAKIVSINMIVFLILLLIVDNTLYFLAPYLPQQFVNEMSTAAYARLWEHKMKNEQTGDYYHENGSQFFYYGRPLHSYFDEFGYRNPPGYLKKHMKTDVLVLGDSFIESVNAEVAVTDDLREELMPMTVYSLGIAGQGIPHWKLQFERYMHLPEVKSPPAVVVLNFYGANDVIDTKIYYSYIGYSGRYNFSFFREIMALVQYAAIFTPRQHLKARFNLPGSEVAHPSLPGPLAKIQPSVAVAEPATEKNVAVATQSSSPGPFVKKEVDPSSHTDPAGEKKFQNSPLGAAFVPEELLSSENKIVHESLKEVIQVIRTYSPQTRIILSYNPTTQTCYQDDTQQKQNSAVLAQWTKELGVEYMDVSDELRQEARNQLIHQLDFGGHFNEKGNHLYAKLMAATIKNDRSGRLVRPSAARQ